METPTGSQRALVQTIDAPKRTIALSDSIRPELDAQRDPLPERGTSEGRSRQEANGSLAPILWGMLDEGPRVVSNNGQNPYRDLEPPLEPVVDDDGWPEPHYCPVAFPLVQKVTGALTIWTKKCGLWKCKSCGEERARKVLGLAKSDFGSRARVWYAVLDDRGSSTLAALRKRKQRAGRPRVVRVHRDDIIHVFSHGDLSGSDVIEGSETWMVSADALEFLRCFVLRLPGVQKSSPSGSLREPGQHAHGSGSYLAPVGPVTPKTAKRIEEWVRERLPGVSEVANGADIHPELVELLVQMGYEDLKKSIIAG